MKYALLALQYLPYVLAGVKAVEQVVGAGQGATKKQLVLDAVTSAAQVGEQVPEQHVQVVSALIDNVVATLNKVGFLNNLSAGTTAAAVASK